MINLGTLNNITVSNDDFLPISIIKQVKKTPPLSICSRWSYAYRYVRSNVGCHGARHRYII